MIDMVVLGNYVLKLYKNYEMQLFKHMCENIGHH